MRISDWSSDVCSSDLDVPIIFISAKGSETDRIVGLELGADDYLPKPFGTRELIARIRAILRRVGVERGPDEHRENEARFDGRSEEHTSELQSLMRTSYAVFCLKKKKNDRPQDRTAGTN